MHILSEKHRSEFMAVPQLARFTVAKGANGPEPTLLIKASTLTLKYLLRLKRFRLIIFRIHEKWLAYGVQIDDDPEKPAVLWSLLEYADELSAIHALVINPKCSVFLFNELAVNVTWGEASIDLSDNSFCALIESAILHPTSDNQALVQVEQRFEQLHRKELAPTDGQILDVPPVQTWHPLRSHYITNRITNSLVSIFESDEGGQQEEVALWLVDNLHPAGAIKSPQIYEKETARELTDLLLTYEHGSFLIESKTLSISDRETLPNRSKLSRDVIKHLEKATKQLIGGIKNLRRGHRITDLKGQDIQVEREKIPHAIVLVPDISLLSDSTEFGGKFIKKVFEECQGLLHILDPSELLRMVQAAEMISKHEKNATPIMTFDFYLVERAKRALASNTPDFSMLLRFQDETNTEDKFE